MGYPNEPHTQCGRCKILGKFNYTPMRGNRQVKKDRQEISPAGQRYIEPAIYRSGTRWY
jgi:hypothetical protein